MPRFYRFALAFAAMTLARTSLASLMVAVVAVACSGWKETLRSGTYPPSFEYISSEQLDSVMWQMARDTRDLEQILAQNGAVSDADRRQVLALLAAVYDESGRLGSEGTRTNHPMLDDDRDRFRADVATARHGVESEPPSYSLARTVSAACVHCHNRSMH
jgi:hypothetical protein